MNIYDYESWGMLGCKPQLLGEYYSGQETVDWQGRIERQLIKHIEEYEAAHNTGYADKLRAFMQMWRQHPLTGSLNVETIDALSSATEVLAVDPWKLQNYFSNLRDNLRKLTASVEELPMDIQSRDMEQGMGPPGGGGGGGGGEMGGPEGGPKEGEPEEPEVPEVPPAGNVAPTGPGQPPVNPEEQPPV